MNYPRDLPQKRAHDCYLEPVFIDLPPASIGEQLNDLFMNGVIHQCMAILDDYFSRLRNYLNPKQLFPLQKLENISV